jgi:DNA (cytosine-5)-methyltransferase 1
MLPTPTAAEANKIPAKANYGQIGLNNHPLLRGYPTRPKATKSRKGEKMVFPTPTASDSNYADPKHDHKKRILRGVVHNKNLTAHEANLIGQLNPTWVEWLMGYPTGWTA